MSQYTTSTMSAANGKKNRPARLLGLCLTLASLAFAATGPETQCPGRVIDFQSFLRMVADHNLDYAVEKFNVSIAAAEIEIAKISPDPTGTFEWTENREERRRSGYGFSFELGKTIELGGKRRARIDLAKSRKELAALTVTDFFRELRAQAAIAYVDALAQKELYDLKSDSYQAMKRLSDAIRTRFEMGANPKIDVTQSELEAGILLNELKQSEVDCQNMNDTLAALGGVATTCPLVPCGSLKKPTVEYRLAPLLEAALANRTDLLAVKQNQLVAEKATLLAAKNRAIDLDLSVGYGHDYPGVIAAPIGRNFSIGLSVPLKVSNLRRGELQIARGLVFFTEAPQPVRDAAGLEEAEKFVAEAASVAAVEAVSERLERAHDPPAHGFEPLEQGGVALGGRIEAGGGGGKRLQKEPAADAPDLAVIFKLGHVLLGEGQKPGLHHAQHRRGLEIPRAAFERREREGGRRQVRGVVPAVEEVGDARLPEGVGERMLIG